MFPLIWLAYLIKHWSIIRSLISHLLPTDPLASLPIKDDKRYLLNYKLVVAIILTNGGLTFTVMESTSSADTGGTEPRLDTTRPARGPTRTGAGRESGEMTAGVNIDKSRGPTKTTKIDVLVWSVSAVDCRHITHHNSLQLKLYFLRLNFSQRILAFNI